MKKTLRVFTLLVLCFSFVAVVSAASSVTLNNKYFESGKSYSGEATLGVDFTTSITVLEKSNNNPTINTRVQAKVLFIWNQGANADIIIRSANTTYFNYWVNKKTYDMKITWKQTSDYADMTANLKAYNS